jgi:large repetitive protein
MKDKSYRTGCSAFGMSRGRLTTFRRAVAILALVVIGTTITACTGGGSGAAAPLVGIATASVEDSLGRSPNNVINAETADEVEVVVELPASTRATDAISVILSDGTNEVVTEVNGIDGGGPMVIGPIDATSLQDGPISMTLVISRGDQSVTTEFGDILVMDTSMPLAATSFFVPATATSPAGIVNANDAATFSAEVSFDPAGDPSNLVSLVITDGTTVVESLAENVDPGNTVTFSGIDLTSLQDGLIQVTVQTVDASENRVSLPATFTLDTQVGTTVAARVAAGPQSAQDVTNLVSRDNVTIEVDLGTDVQTGDQIEVIVRDSNGELRVIDTTDALVGGGTMNFGAISFTPFADGAITIDVAVRDASGNEHQFSTSNALLDTSVSAMQFLRFEGFDGGDRDVTIIGGANTMAKVKAIFSGPAGDAESINLTITHIASGVFVNSPTMSIPVGATSQIYGPFDLSAMPEGEIRIDWVITDANGNIRSDRGQNGLIDRTAHTGPSSMEVITTVGNPNRIINAASVASTTVRAQVPAFDDDGVQARVFLNDGNVEIASALMAVPAAGGAMDFPGMDASSLAEGQVAMAMEFRDSFGNVTRYSGGNAQKDTLIALPSSAQIEAGINNPANSVNSSSQSNVTVRVEVPSSASSSDMFGVAIGDGSLTVNAPAQAAPQGGGTMTFSGIDLSTLGNGPIAISVVGVDLANNQNIMVGTPAMKDTETPGATRLRVAAGATNGIDELNAANATNAMMTIRFENVAAGDSYRVSFLDATGASVNSPLQSIASLFSGSSTTSITPINDDYEINTGVLSGDPNQRIGDFEATFPAGISALNLADGPIALRLEVVDAAGNSSTFQGVPAQKSSAPTLPTSARVAAGAQNAQDIVNASNVAAATIEVVMPAAATVDDQVHVRVSDGAAIIDAPSQAAPAGGGTMTFVMDLSSFNDSNVSVTAIVDNPLRRRGTLAGVMARKDVVAPNFASNVGLSSDEDATISAAEIGSVDIFASLIGTSDGTDTLDLAITDGSSVINLASGAALPSNDVFADGSLTTGADITLSYPATNLSSFNDGQVTATWTIRDAAGNTQSGSLAFATIDATAPAAPQQVFVAEGPSWQRNQVVAANVASARILVNTDATGDPEDRIEFSFADASGVLMTIDGGAIVNPGSQLTFGPFDLSGIPDGVSSLRTKVFDRAGNASVVMNSSFTKDSTVPGAPSAIGIPMSSDNVADFVTATTESSVDFDLTFGADSFSTDQIEMAISDGASTIDAVAQSAPQGAGTVSFTGVDLSTLNDGTLMVNITITDPIGNVTTAATTVTKDSMLATPTLVEIPADVGNAQNVVNASNEGALSIEVTFPAAADGTETAAVTLGDGVGSVVYLGQAVPAGGGVMTFGPLDVSGLNDAALTINVVTTDPSGNSQTTMQAAVKDSTDPAAATAAAIPSTGANQPANFVNIATESSVSVEVTLPATSVATDMVTVTLDDGSTQVTGTVAGSAGAGTVTVTGINATGLNETSIAITVDIVDAGGNSSPTFTGTAGAKDVTPPASAIVDPVTSPSNVTTQVVTGATEANGSVEVSGGSMLDTATADAAGFFAVTVNLATMATNTLSVTTRDAAGNPAAAATTLDFNGAALSIDQGSVSALTYVEDAAARGLADTGNADGGAFADMDGDGDLDLFLAQGSAGILYANDGSGAFTDITGSAGVTFVGDRGAVWGDYDNDGDLDLLTIDSVAGTSLYRNDGGGVFSDQTVAEAANVASTTLSQVYWTDHDQDGFLDFLVLDSNPVNGNVIMVNQRGAGVPSNSFAAASGTGVETTTNGSTWGGVADFDVDGDIDVLFSDGAAGGALMSNAAGSYTQVPSVSFNVQTLNSPAVFVDYDNDGDLDLHIPHGGGGDVGQLLRNDAGTFVDTGLLQFDQFFDMRDVVWGDVDNDGLLDMYYGSGGSSNNSLARQQSLGNFGLDAVAVDGDDTRLVQLVDVDGDGDLDLFCGKTSGTANALYINGLDNFNYLKVNVEGTGTGSGTSSRDARGAVVTLKLTDGTIVATREVNGGRGKGTQDAGPIHFGGVAPSRQYQVEVSFPSGTTQTMTVTPRLLANQTVTISE